jgi:hypothetical protein
MQINVGVIDRLSRTLGYALATMNDSTCLINGRFLKIIEIGIHAVLAVAKKMHSTYFQKTQRLVETRAINC